MGLMKMSFTPTELQLKKDKVFAEVTEAVLADTPDANLQNVLDNVIKPRKVDLKAQIRNEKIGKKK